MNKTGGNRKGAVFLAAFAAFATYSCMYAFRKSFSVGVFEDMYYLGVDYKSLLIIAQAIGYMMSKFLGIKFVSELKKKYRALLILGLIGASEVALVLFAKIPAPYNFWCLFLNGLPLGMIWGIVFSYLEGRSNTEILGAILSVSFILASNISKSVAQWVMVEFGVSALDMPYLVGLIFSIPLLLSVYLLNKIPEPDEKDIAQRLAREPMNASGRRKSMKTLGSTMLFMIFGYILLTVFRDVRSNYASDVWMALGYEHVPSIYITTAIPATLIVILSMSLLYLIKENVKALIAIEWMVLAGFLSLGLSTAAFEMGLISGVVWVVLTMTGTYISYIPFNCFIFERMIPTFKLSGSNVGFLIYVADAFGYLAGVGVLLYKNFFTPGIDWHYFIIQASYFVAVGGVAVSMIVLFRLKAGLRKAKKSEEILIPEGGCVRATA